MEEVFKRRVVWKPAFSLNAFLAAIAHGIFGAFLASHYWRFKIEWRVGAELALSLHALLTSIALRIRFAFLSCQNLKSRVIWEFAFTL